MANLLLFSDLHCSQSAAHDIVDQATSADLVIGAGDFANQHRGIEKTLDILKAISAPMIFVPGNNETEESLRQACESIPTAIVLHGSAVEVDGLTIFGIGGGIPVTPFGAWSFDFSEEQAEAMLSTCLDAKILVSHSPPFGHVDRTSTGQNVGSRAVLNAVRRAQPQLVVCGHIHDSWQQQSSLDRSTIINVGPQSQWFEVS